MPKTVRVLSWNYDHQFELGFNQFSDYNSFEKNNAALGIIPKNKTITNSDDRFSIFKINGTASFLESSTGNETIKFDLFNKRGYDLELIEDIVRFYGLATLTGEFQPMLSFAWEIDSSKSIDHAIKQTSDTNVPVIIGYSFPFFNREIDQQLLAGMSDDLRTVYIQSKEPENIEERFRTSISDSTGIDVVLKNDTEQFLLSNQLEL